MHLTKSGIIVFLALLLSAPGFASAQSVPQLAQKALAATVSLEVQDENGDTLGRGSGFLVRPKISLLQTSTSLTVQPKAMSG